VRGIMAILVIAGCSTDRDANDDHMKQIDAATFRSMLQCGDPAIRDQPRCEGLRDDVFLVESVRVEPRDKGSARYVVTMKNSQRKNVVYAKYPGRILDELTAALIMYSMKSRD
jgi:hypothetical protein